MQYVLLARFSPPAAPRLLDVTALTCLVAGNTIGGYICPPEWMVLGLFPPFLIGVALVVVRCVVWPEPSLLQTWWPAVATRHGLTRKLATFALLTRAGVLAAGLAASLIHPGRLIDAPRISPNPAVTLPARWDAFWYLGIARYGYQWAPGDPKLQQNIAFFPAHPLAMRVAGDLVTIPAYLLKAPMLLGGGDGRVLWGGVLASMVFFLLAISRVHQLAWEDTGDAAAAGRACLLLATYPFALFFSAPYSESLALLALASVVLAWRRQDTRAGALWGLVFGLCRSNGWCVAVALAADRLLRRRGHMEWRRAWILIAAAPVGAALYSLYVYHLTGDPFAWATAQHAWGQRLQPLAFITRRWHMLQFRGVRGYMRHDPADAFSFIAAAGMIVTGGYLLIRRQWLYGLLMVAYLAPAVLIDLPATGRLTAVLFPAFILLGSRLKGPWFVAVVLLFAIGQTWFACRFFLWETPY